MSSRRLDDATSASRKFWRTLAQSADWDVSRAAQLHGITVRQLERLCQRDLGLTPSEWLKRERMAAAGRLLTAGQSVKAVALSLGYSRPANFSRDFKRHHGRTPRTFAPPRLFFEANEAGQSSSPLSSRPIE